MINKNLILFDSQYNLKNNNNSVYYSQNLKDWSQILF